MNEVRNLLLSSFARIRRSFPLRSVVKVCSCALPVTVLLLLCGCGNSNNSSSSTSGAVSVSVSPTSATVAASFTQQFTAKVQNTSNTNVTWQVNGVTGGNSTFGQITGTGLYTAPASVPGSATVTVTAISVADTSKTADASVTIALPIAVSPSTASVQATGTQQFTASVSFSSTTGVTWQVNGIAGGNSTIGTISSAGLYTAPSTVPTPSKVTVTAVANADNSRSASAAVTVTPPPLVISPASAVLGAGTQQTYTATALSNTVNPAWSVTCSSKVPGGCGSITSGGTYTAPITPPPQGLVTVWASMPDGGATTASVTATVQFGNGSLAGQYVFTTADDISHLAPARAGTLVLDGSGNISGGLFDSTDAPGTPISVTGGTYQVGSDGRGTAVVQTETTSFNLTLVLSSNAQGFVVQTDSTGNQGAGTIDLQQNMSGSSALNGAYVLAVSGISTGPSAAFFAEAGSILSSSGTISGGVVDQNNDLVLQKASVTGGSFTQPASGGRGVLTLSTATGYQVFAYYPVDNTRAKLVVIDGTLAARGDLYLQLPGPFSNSTLKGRYAFSVTGASNGNPFGAAGVFSLDGSTNVTDQQFDGIAQTVFDFNPGVYAVTDPTTGRTTATWTANGGFKLQYVLYPRADGGLVLLESDGVYASSGMALPQAALSTGNFFSSQGAFAFGLGGSELSTPSIAEHFTGQLSAASTALSGTTDGTNIGQGNAITLNLLGLNPAPQRYVVGIASTALAGGPIILYRIDGDRAFMIESDETRLLTGVLQRQY